MTRRIGADDRGASTTVSHVLAIGITAILVIGLIATFGSYLQDQRERVAEQELETIGNRLATELVQIDQLGSRGGRVAMTASHPEKVAGSPYTVDLAEGPRCNTPTFDTDYCLVLSTEGFDIVEKVPVRNDTEVSLLQVGNGQFRILSTGELASGGAAAPPLSLTDRQSLSPSDLFSLSVTAGVGSGVDEDVSTAAIEVNRPPVARFTFLPGSPYTHSNITLSGEDSFDPNGPIADYEWANESGDTISNGPVSTVEFTEPGPTQIQLTVSDEEGGTQTRIKNVTISGLEYNDDMTTISSNGVEFSMLNNWTDAGYDVEIRGIRINTDDSINEIDCGGGWTTCVDNDELEIDTSGGTIERDIERDVPNGGLIETGFGSPQNIVNPGDDMDVTIRGFDSSLEGTEVEITVLHTVDGQTNTTVFSDVPGGPDLISYDLRTVGSDRVDAVITTNQEISEFKLRVINQSNGSTQQIQYSGPGDISNKDGVTLTDSPPGPYVYTIENVNNNRTGRFTSTLEDLFGFGGDPSDGIPASDSVRITSGYTWDGEDAWEGIAFQEGVVHADWGPHPGSDKVSLGYPGFDEWESNLVTYYPFNNSASNTSVASDLSGNGHDGNLNSITTAEPGIFGYRSYGFTSGGTADYVQDPDADSYLNGKDAVTVTMWVRADTITQNMGLLNGEDSSGDGTDDRLTIRHDEVGADSGLDPCDCFKSGITTNLDGETNVETALNTADSANLSTWSHLAITWSDEDGQLRVYVNGTELAYANEEFANGVLSDITELEIGRGPKFDSAGGWDGNIDEVRIYDRELPQSQIAALADARNGSFVTDWRNGSAIDPEDLELDYGVQIGDSDQNISVVVQSDPDDDGVAEQTSDPLYLDDGVPPSPEDVPGLAGPVSSNYRLRVEITGESITATNPGPTIDELRLTS